MEWKKFDGSVEARDAAAALNTAEDRVRYQTACVKESSSILGMVREIIKNGKAIAGSHVIVWLGIHWFVKYYDEENVMLAADIGSVSGLFEEI